MLLREIKSIFHKELDDIYGIGEVDSFFYLMIEHYLNLERFVLALQPDLIISKDEEQPLFEGLSELKLERPIQYILGKTEFLDLEFAVNESVLIPRPETEELVRWILDDEVKRNTGAERSRSVVSTSLNDPIHILDIGTGSGCIAIALAKNLPNSKVVALDVSDKALAVAKRNAVANEAEIEFVLMDVLKQNKLHEKFDIIVSNPPYVRELEKKKISKNVMDHEPEIALFVSDENPLLFYRTIADIAKKGLKKGGSLYLEINQYLGADTKQLLEEADFSEIELRKDLFGNDRMLKGKMSP